MRFRGLVFATRNALLRRHVVVLVSVSSVKKTMCGRGASSVFAKLEVFALFCLETTEKEIRETTDTKETTERVYRKYRQYQEGNSQGLRNLKIIAV